MEETNKQQIAATVGMLESIMNMIDTLSIPVELKDEVTESLHKICGDLDKAGG